MLNGNNSDVIDGAKAFLKNAMNLSVGETNVDVTIQIRGTVTKGEDYSQQVWQSAKPEQLLRLLCAYSPLMRSVMEKALADNDVAARLANLSEERDETVDAFIALARQNAVRECSGKTTFSGLEVVTIVDVGSQQMKEAA